MKPGQIINDSFELYSGFWKHILSIALVIAVGVAVLSAVLAPLGIVGGILAIIVAVIGSTLLQGSIVKVVEDVRDGRVDLTVRETLEAARPHIASLIIAGIVVGILVVIGLIIFIIPGIILATLWFVTAPAIVLENKGPIEGMTRSWNLVKKNFWQTLGVALLTLILLFVAGFVLGIILSPLSDFLAGLISNLVSFGVFAPFAAIASALTFFTLRQLFDPSAVPQAAPPPAEETF